MSNRSEFWELLLSLRAGATLTLLSIFVIGVLLMGLVSNTLYSLLVDPASLGVGMARVLLFCGVLVAAAYGLYWREQHKPRRVQVVLDESRLAPPHRGLVWLLGPGSVEHALHTIRHHAGGLADGQVLHCWLVMQRGNAAVQIASNTLASQVAENKLAARLEPVLVDRPDVESTYQAVRHVFEQKAPAEGLSERDVVADITGGTKPMTTGMVLASLDGARDLEYVESQRDDAGDPIPGTLHVVWVNKSFRLEKTDGQAD